MKKNFWVLEMPKYSIIIFCLLNVIGMWAYPGGTIHDMDQVGYSFTHNFFSDLGATVTHSDLDNTVSSILFNISLCVSGVTFIMLFWSFRNVFDLKILSWLATLFGVMGGISFIGVACTPSNLLMAPHITFAHGIFRCLCIASFLYTILIVKTKDFDNKYAYGFIVFGIMVLAYILISELGPDARISQSALILQVVSQKIIAIWILVAILLYSRGLGKYLHKRS